MAQKSIANFFRTQNVGQKRARAEEDMAPKNSPPAKRMKSAGDAEEAMAEAEPEDESPKKAAAAPGKKGGAKTKAQLMAIAERAIIAEMEAQQAAAGTAAPPPPPPPPPPPAPALPDTFSDEQKERMEASRLAAIERAKARKERLEQERAAAATPLLPPSRSSSMASMGRQASGFPPAFVSTMSHGDILSTLHDSWKKALEPEFKKDYWKKLTKFLASNKKTMYPPAEHVFNAFAHCPFDQVKVVILGQDPYHNVGQAHGLCFSVLPGVKRPPSLQNIFKELERSIPGWERPDHGCLDEWAKQGVFLLNTLLTVDAHSAFSHKKKGWEQFTDAVIKKLLAKKKDIVFLLWGGAAEKKAGAIDKKRHVVLTAPHPSPLSARHGWFGSDHFNKCNKALEDRGKPIIDWAIPKLGLPCIDADDEEEAEPLMDPDDAGTTPTAGDGPTSMDMERFGDDEDGSGPSRQGSLASRQSSTLESQASRQSSLGQDAPAMDQLSIAPATNAAGKKLFAGNFDDW